MQVSKFGFEGRGTRSESNALFGNLAPSLFGRNCQIVVGHCRCSSVKPAMAAFVRKRMNNQ